jgi:molybdate transport system substrate-binding protein
MKKTTILAAAMVLLAGAAPASAAQLKIFVGGAMTQPLREVAASYAKTSGDTFDFVSDTTGSLQRRLKAGEKADIIVVTSTAIDAMQKDRFIADGSRVDLARALIGVAIKSDSKFQPDLSTPDTFKATVLKARSVAYVNPAAGGTSGTYFEGLVKKMGIADQVKAKTVYRTQGSEVADSVAKGEAEIGITFTSEMLPNKGVKVVGTLPDAIQLPTNYVAAVSSTSANAKAAAAFIRAMRTAEGSKAIRAGGMEPLNEIH